MYDLRQFPIIVGVTGHRDIASAAIPDVRGAVRAVLEAWNEPFKGALYILTALADGADQLVADEAAAIGIHRIAVLPMDRDAYRATIKNKRAFDDHLKHAELTLVLPDVEPAFVAGYHERQYEQLGVLLARRSHLLLALSDGQPDPANHAGTAAVVRARLFNDERAELLRGSPLFLGAGSTFRLTNPGPLLRIMTPRHGTVMDDASRSAGDCFLFDVRGPSRQQSQADPVPRRVEPAQSYDCLEKQTLRDFNHIRRLNFEIAHLDDPDELLFNRQLTDVTIPDLPPDVTGDADKVSRLLAAADTVALNCQSHLMGHFVPASSLAHMRRKLRGVRDLGRKWPRLGAVFLLTAAVPVAVLSFESYAHMHGGLGAYIIYLITLLCSYFFYQYRLSNHDMQNRFQDYRALAEALRVQLYWALSAVPASVSDHYLGKQIGELGWIQLALRGPSLWAATLARRLGNPRRQLVTAHWMVGQRNYFLASSELNEAASKRAGELVRGFLVLAIMSSLALLGMEIFHAFNSWCMTNCDQEDSPGYWVREILRVTVATSPVIGAFFTVSGELRAYEPHARSYGLMRWIFDRAMVRVARIEKINLEHLKNKEFQQLVYELGREALAENAEWLVDHRHRPVGSELSGAGSHDEQATELEAAVEEPHWRAI